MASPGNQHCANCIGTLSFPIHCRSAAGPRVSSWQAVSCGYINAESLEQFYGSLKTFWP